MIQLTPQMRILVCVPSVDFRKGIDGLSRICREEMGSDPFSGVVFVFRNRQKTSLKILIYDGQGFWLCQKRLSEGRFRCWPDESEGRLNFFSASQLQTLIFNGNPWDARYAPDWRKIG